MEVVFDVLFRCFVREVSYKELWFYQCHPTCRRCCGLTLYLLLLLLLWFCGRFCGRLLLYGRWLLCCCGRRGLCRFCGGHCCLCCLCWNSFSHRRWSTFSCDSGCRSCFCFCKGKREDGGGRSGQEWRKDGSKEGSAMVELDGDIFLEREGGEKRRKEKEKERGKKGRGRRKNLWTSHVRIPLTDVRQTNYACSIVVLCTCAS